MFCDYTSQVLYHCMLWAQFSFPWSCCGFFYGSEWSKKILLPFVLRMWWHLGYKLVGKSPLLLNRFQWMVFQIDWLDVTSFYTTYLSNLELPAWIFSFLTAMYGAAFLEQDQVRAYWLDNEKKQLSMQLYVGKRKMMVCLPICIMHLCIHKFCKSSVGLNAQNL